jgi:TetR/AcrR family transcriptional regulator, transcriptional repressor for nem operon
MTRSGRPRLFAESEVLEGAKNVFWQRGYVGTSMRELREELGVLPGSLYGAFGDKHALFLRSLERFSADMREALSNLVRQGSAVVVVENLLLGALKAARTNPGRGCMLGNTAMELLPGDPEARKCVKASFVAMEDSLADAIRRGQKSGEFRHDLDAHALAAMLVALVQGLHVVARAEAEPQRLEGAVRAFLAVLSPA